MNFSITKVIERETIAAVEAIATPPFNIEDFGSFEPFLPEAFKAARKELEEYGVMDDFHITDIDEEITPSNLNF